MNDADIRNALKAFEVVRDDTFSNDFSFKLPVNHLVVSIDVKLNSSKSAFRSWLTDRSPCCGSFVLVSFGIMNLSVGKVKAKTLFTDLVLNRNVLKRHDPHFDAVNF